MYEMVVVGKGVLLQQREPSQTDSKHQEYLLIVMETIKCILD